MFVVDDVFRLPSIGNAYGYLSGTLENDRISQATSQSASHCIEAFRDQRRDVDHSDGVFELGH